MEAMKFCKKEMRRITKTGSFFIFFVVVVVVVVYFKIIFKNYVSTSFQVLAQSVLMRAFVVQLSLR